MSTACSPVRRRRAKSAPSFHLHAGLLHDLGPSGKIAPDEVAELPRRAALRRKAEIGHALLDVRLIADLADLGVELGDDRLRRRRRDMDAVPGAEHEVGKTGLR